MAMNTHVIQTKNEIFILKLFQKVKQRSCFDCDFKSIFHRMNGFGQLQLYCLVLHFLSLLLEAPVGLTEEQKQC